MAPLTGLWLQTPEYPFRSAVRGDVFVAPPEKYHELRQERYPFNTAVCAALCEV
jgi:hypothetical protein